MKLKIISTRAWATYLRRSRVSLRNLNMHNVNHLFFVQLRVLSKLRDLCISAVSEFFVKGEVKNSALERK